MLLPRFLISALFVFTPVLLAQTNPVPFVNQTLVPTSVAPGSPAFTLTVSGTGFAPASVVKWNGVSLSTTFVTKSKLRANVPASNVAVAKTASVTVFSPAPGGGTSNAVPFTVTVPTSGLTFSSSTISVGLNPGNIVVADFNNDGKPDLAIVNQYQPATCYNYGGKGTISILLGNGDGTFTAKSTLCLVDQLGVYGTPPMVVGDFNGDGKMDLLVSSDATGFSAAGQSELLLGNGDGTFYLEPQGIAEGLNKEFSAIAGDFNSDGKLDLAIPYLDDFGATNIAIPLGNGDGTFTMLWGGVPCSTGINCAYASATVAGDFNGDGILDLAYVWDDEFGIAPPGVEIVLGNGDGTFTKAAQQPTATLINPKFLTAGDFDGDGKLDLAFADASTNNLTILHGNGDGTFTQVQGQPTCQGSTYVATADLNGDGKLDLVFSGAANTVQIFLGNGDGTFQSGFTETVGNGAQALAIADFNGDGRLDIAVVNSADNTVSVLLQNTATKTTTTTLRSSDGDSRYGQMVVFTAAVSVGGRGTPTGHVTFSDGTNQLAFVPLGDGVARLPISTLSAGSHSITAAYSGDATFAPSTSTTLVQTVERTQVGMGIGSNPNPSYANQLVTVWAVVSGGPTTPTGTVVFRNATSVLATVPLVNGTASFTTAFVQSSQIIASYSGDQNFFPNSKTGVQVVKKYATTTLLDSKPNPSTHGSIVTFSAKVNSPGPIPTGDVVFSYGNQVLGSAALVNGVATITSATLPIGSLSFMARYQGDAVSNQSQSLALIKVVR